MDLLINIVTNASFLGLFTLIITEIFKRRLQTHKGEIDKEIESLKGDLQFKLFSEQDKLNQKRDVYISLIDTMSVFVDGRVDESGKRDYINKFLKAHDIVWLWGSDNVIKALSHFLKVNQGLSPGNLHEAYSQVVIEMRKDIGFESTEVFTDDYVYIKP
jgi:hypothetical protein